MRSLGLTLVVAFATLTSAFKNVAPGDKEAIYTWTADVKAGTHLPVSYASQFTLQGKIHLQAKNDSTLAKITDLTYGIYNGIIDDQSQTHEVPVPPEVKDLGNVFKIVYDAHGTVEGIVTEYGEKEFSRNIKKAIATIFQVNSSVFEKENHYPEAFVTKEKSVLGHGFVDYTIYPHGDEIEVHKLHDMPNPREMFSFFLTNIEPRTCAGKPEQMIMHDSKKEYYIVKEDGHHVIKKIVATGSIVYYPFEAKSAAHIVLTNQTFNLHEVVPVENEYQVEKEHAESSLTYHTFEDTHDGTIFDVTNGRSTTDVTKLIPVLQEMFKDVAAYLEEDHIKAEQPDIKRGQLINRIQRVLLKFNIEKLQELEKTLSDDALKAFYFILPIVRTDASSLYIKDLIVSKKVTGSVAMEMLQHMPENTRPWEHLLPKLEELIHLDDSYEWEVRKSAILTFGTLIHKSYIFSNATEEPYEKYVEEYIEQLRSHNDYKTQIVYILGLRNMQLPMLVEKLRPAFNGEWWQDKHLRFMSMFAAIPSILASTDSDVVIETLWPIFTNRDELTEMRIFAFYHIIQATPSDSRLKNILDYMLTEENEEVYRFYYMYLKAVIESKNPCKEEMRVKLRQLMKFSPPPILGLSSAHFYGYKDVHYGFSLETESYFLKTNTSRCYADFISTQQHNVLREEYMYYLIINDGENDFSGIVGNSLSDVARVIEKFTNKSQGEKLHIEAGFLKRGQVLYTYYFDETNFEDLSFLDLYKPENRLFKHDLFHINYDGYHRGLIPTDLGIPAVWEYLMPDVSYNRLTYNKTITNKGLEIKLSNNYVNWIHYRHGLSFYNPIGDVWQGVNRYQAYDSVFPLQVEAVLAPKEGIFDLSWKPNGVMGLRSFVTQGVFVRDDYNTTQFEVVASEKKFRHDYPLVNVDDPNSGHNWHVSIFDSSEHGTYGLFQHQLYLVGQTATKYFGTPGEYISQARDNLVRYSVNAARPGHYGIVIRGVPIVTSIDLSMHFAGAVDTSHILKASRWLSDCSLSVKNNDQIIKTWNLETDVYTKLGHQLVYFTGNLTRKIPNEKDFKITAAGGRFWFPQALVDFLNVTVDDDATINVTMVGKRSQAQIDENHIYDSCQYVIPFARRRYHTMQCLVAHSTLRHYTYEVKANNLPDKWKTYLDSWWGYVKSQYHSYAWHSLEHTNSSEIRVEVEFPVEDHEVGVNITTPEEKYEFSGVPLEYLRWYGLVPESAVYPKYFLDLYKNNKVDRCSISYNHYNFNKIFVPEVVPRGWILYTSMEGGEIYLKRVGDKKIAMTAYDGEYFFQVLPNGDSYKAYEGVPPGGYNSDKKIYYHIFSRDVRQPIVIFLRNSLILVEYDIYHVTIVTPREIKANGLCYSHLQ